MRILHTSDWHLGKTLEGYFRLEEQEEFLEELYQIVEREEVDLILLAGDIYDHFNPPAAAEKLFYDSMKRLSNDGQRPIVVIAGNHDNPDRLTAANPLAYDHGIIPIGSLSTLVPKGSYKGFGIVESGPGYIEIDIRGERVVILALPYPSEKRLNEIFIRADREGEKEEQKNYSEKVGQIFEDLSKHYRDDTINIATSHLYLIGGEESTSERQIQLGGSLAVNANHLPQAQYVALGHLHRPQKAAGPIKAYYSGSPIQYSKSEIGYSKCLYLVDLAPGEEAQVQQILLRNYKPIEVWRCKGIEEALDLCSQRAEDRIWTYLEIETDRVLTIDEIKAIRDIKKDIVEIKPILLGEEREENELETIGELTIRELFEKFYLNKRGVSPSQDIIDTFSKIIGEGEDHETS